MSRRRWAGITTALALVAVLLLTWPGTTAGQSLPVAAPENTVHVFFSGGCADCWPYLEETLLPALSTVNLAETAEVHDFTRPGGRVQLLEMSDQAGLPREMADSMYAFIPLGESNVVSMGHVPRKLLEAALSLPERPAGLVIWQPQMHGEPVAYKLWAFAGEPQTFAIDTPLAKALSQLEIAQQIMPVNSLAAANLAAMLPAVVVSALVDSVNPCAFAVILLLLAFLFTLRQARARVLALGTVYISVIFVVYFAIGLGLMQAVRISSDPHFVARLGGWLLIGLGAVNLQEWLWPNTPLKLHMPASAHGKVNSLLKKTSIPATIAVGFIVGLCTFPCSGGVYVSIITLLAAKTTYVWGLGYLTLYNFLFVLPLVGILLAVGNRTTAKQLAQWERRHALRLRLWFGSVMVALGVIMLWWII
jgi:cytochrome c biogenesis protein CcdA